MGFIKKYFKEFYGDSLKKSIFPQENFFFDQTWILAKTTLQSELTVVFKGSNLIFQWNFY